MLHLSRTERAGVDRAADAVRDARGLAEFEFAAVHGVAGVVAADRVAYQESGLADGRVRYHTADAATRSAWLRLEPAFERHVAQHPVAQHYADFGIDYPRKISDFLDPAAWHRHPLYQSFYRELGVECQILVPNLPPGRRQKGEPLPAVSLDRARRDFSERERAVLAQLMPHLVQARARAAELDSLRRRLRIDALVLARLGKGIVELDACGLPTRVDSVAAEAITRAFGASPGTLPRDVTSWLRSGAPRTQLVRECSRERIALHDLGTMAGRRVVLVEISCKDEQPGRLRCLGLTEREAQVLYWVSQGKSNGDVGTILGIRERTVAKHLEGVYQKLEVDSRTAATLRALEILEAPSS